MNQALIGLDIGTNKVACVVGERNGLGGVDIIGIGTAPSTGLRKGVVINIEDTNRSIRSAIDAIEMAENPIILAGGNRPGLSGDGRCGVRHGGRAMAD